MKKVLIAAGVAAAFSIQPVYAAEINDQGAQTLKDNLSYILPEKAKKTGFLTVKPAGDHYQISYDFAKLLEAIDKKGFTVSGLTPLTVSAAPMDNGQWKLSGNNDMNVAVKGTGPEGKPLDMTYSLTGAMFSGIFDPAISYVRSGEMKSGPIRMVSKSGPEEIEASFAGMNYVLTSNNAAKAGAIDFQGKGSFSRFYERIVTPEAPPVQIRAESLDFDVGVQGVVAEKIRGLMSFVFELVKDEKPSEAEIAKLKELIQGAMPFFSGLSEKLSFNQFTVESPMGDFGLGKLDYTLSMTEPSEATRIGIGVGVEKISVPAGLVPETYAGLMPEKAEVQVGVADLNFRRFIDTLMAMDLSKPGPMPEEESDKLGQAILKDGLLTIDFPRVFAKSALYDIEASGKMTGNPEEKDEYSIETSVLARDIDKLIQYVQSAAKSDPQMNQVAFGIMMAKGMGKTEPDGRLRWDISFKDGDTLTVNGQPLK